MPQPRTKPAYGQKRVSRTRAALRPAWAAASCASGMLKARFFDTTTTLGYLECAPDVLDHGTSARGVWKFPLVASCRISLSYPIAKCQRLLPRIGVGCPTATMVFSVAPIRGVLVMKTIGSALTALTVLIGFRFCPRALAT
jgi:hypothetical protein